MNQLDACNIKDVTFNKSDSHRRWDEIMRFPSLERINYINKTSRCRSPYLTAWLDTNIEGGFSQYAVDFKADYLPYQTYCSLGNFFIDYSSLRDKYKSVDNGGGISAYCGFQRINKPNSPEYIGILSIWDAYCVDKSGKKDTIRAKLISSSSGAKEVSYSNEGIGISCRPEYLWQPKKWYRMLVQCAEPQNGGNTKLEFWVGDLETKKWTNLCIFDLGAPGLKFKNSTAVFLEDWLTETAGEIRTLEFKNVRIYSSSKRKWISVKSGYLNNRDNDESLCFSGSYQYGADNSTFWMITSGVPNCASAQPSKKFSVNIAEEGSPLELN